jgi:hypothetical protein
MGSRTTEGHAGDSRSSTASPTSFRARPGRTCSTWRTSSSWEERANDYLPRPLGLPGPLPFISFENKPAGGAPHWKLPAIDAYAGDDRPLAWIDDAHDAESRAWARNRPGPTLLVDTEPATGITGVHVGRLKEWARGLHSG